MKPKVLISWSGGKDSALALWHARDHYQIDSLVTAVTMPFDRISVHGVRTELLEQQARSLGARLVQVKIPYPCPNEQYESAMRNALEAEFAAGIERVICGDIFLEDVRRYREERLFGPDRGVFPLWLRDTKELAREFIDAGFRAILCCVDTQALDASFAGREFDHRLLGDLPGGVDPCGENGEFHTFVYDGPIFAKPIPVSPGERVLREERFQFCDLFPV